MKSVKLRQEPELGHGEKTMKRISIMTRHLIVAMVAIISAGTTASASANSFSNGFGAVTVVHGVPGLPEPVEVFVDGQYVFSFEYGDVMGPFNGVGTYDVEIKLLGSTVLSGELDVTRGSDQTVIAHLLEGGGITLSVFENDNSPIANGESRIAVRHTADAVPVELDVYQLGEIGDPVDYLATLGPIANGEQAGPVDLPAAVYATDIAVPNSETLVDTVEGSAHAGFRYTLYAVGIPGDSFTVIRQRDRLPSGKPAWLDHGNDNDEQ